MKPNHKISKLLLNRETIRKLKSDELKAVAGGAEKVTFTDCVSDKRSCGDCSFNTICWGCGR